ncbi:MAG: GNAT family N-acetyltransferase [Acidimicrobiales bacterium]
MNLDIERIPTAATYPLRHAILRPHQSIGEMHYAQDDVPGTASFGAIDRDTGDIVGVATVIPESAPFDPSVVGILPGPNGAPLTAWRLRGMAVRQDLQGQGVGALVLNRAMDHVANERGDLIWCNARARAITFYERAGFVTFGERWEIPDIGWHVVMWRPAGISASS